MTTPIIRHAILTLVWLVILPVTVHAQQSGTTYGSRFRFTETACTTSSGTGSPEGAVVGDICDLYVRADTGTVYTKITGTGTNTGWSALLKTGDSTTALPPSGAIFFITSGTCPTGTTEASDLNGKTLFGTLAANKDVGATGGSDTITPAGANSAPAFTGSAATSTGTSGGTPAGTISYPANVPGFTGGAATSTGTSGGTPAGTISYPANVPSFSGGAVDSSEVSGGTPAGSVAWPVGVPAFTGSSVTSGAQTGGTPAGTIAWPAGVPTFTGTSSTNIVNHLHTLATGTGASGNFAQVNGTVDTSAGGTGATPTQTALATRSGNPVSGGVATYTPEGTIAWPAGVPTFSGSALANHDHSVTAAGTIAWPVGVPTFTGSALAVHKHATTATGTIAWPANPPTFGGSALATHTHDTTATGTIAWPANPPTFTGSALATHTHDTTATGTVAAPVFTGTQFDNRSAYIKVIFCRVD